MGGLRKQSTKGTSHVVPVQVAAVGWPRLEGPHLTVHVVAGMPLTFAFVQGPAMNEAPLRNVGLSVQNSSTVVGHMAMWMGETMPHEHFLGALLRSHCLACDLVGWATAHNAVRLLWQYWIISLFFG